MAKPIIMRLRINRNKLSIIHEKQNNRGTFCKIFEKSDACLTKTILRQESGFGNADLYIICTNRIIYKQIQEIFHCIQSEINNHNSKFNVG